MLEVNRGPSVRPFAAMAALAGASALVLGGPADALTIVPVFASSVTSLSNAKTIEADVDAAAQILDTDLKAPVTVTIDVDWGNLDGTAIASGNVSEDQANVYDDYTYSELLSYMKTAAATNPRDTALVAAAASLPATDPLPINNFIITSADSKALGLMPPTMTNVDGYIGFNSNYAFDFGSTPVTGEYDFEALAIHEMSEVLGRGSGLNTTTPTYATITDLFRYSAPGVRSFSHTAAAYFSINGGVTDLGAFNNGSQYDRSDWASSVVDDVEDATSPTGVIQTLSTADLTLLDALGWDATTNPQGWPTSLTTTAGAAGLAVPEPGSWSLALLGIGLFGAALRRRRFAASLA